MARIISMITGEETHSKVDFSKFYALLRQLPGRPDKKELVSNWTDGGTESLNEMWQYYPQACEDMMRWMDAEVNGSHPYKRASKRRGDVPKEIRQMRSDLLKACAEWGISDRGDGLYWDAINRFLSNPRIAGKCLYNLTDEKELKAVTRRIKTMCYNRERGANRKDHIN